jgi:zinc/manganese transport system substrate-binding protein
MKKILIFVCTLLFAAVAQADKLDIVTTTSDLASIAGEIAGKQATVFSLAKGFQDPHFVEPKPSFLMQLKKADLLVVVGLDLEAGWLPGLLDQSRNAKIRPGASGYLDVSQGVEILDRPTGAVNRSMGDVHAMGNPHYWLDPGNAVRIGIQIANRLKQLDPKDATEYDNRLNAFKKKIHEANQRWSKMLAPYRGTEIVTYHNSWPNFMKRHGLNVVGYVEPKPGVPPSPSHIFALVNLMKEQKVKAVLVEPYFDLKTPNSVAQRAGAKVVVMYPSVGGAKGLDDYVAVFDRNVNALIQALK